MKTRQQLQGECECELKIIFESLLLLENCLKVELRKCQDFNL